MKKTFIPIKVRFFYLIFLKLIKVVKDHKWLKFKIIICILRTRIFSFFYSKIIKHLLILIPLNCLTPLLCRIQTFYRISLKGFTNWLVLFFFLFSIRFFFNSENSKILFIFFNFIKFKICSLLHFFFIYLYFCKRKTLFFYVSLKDLISFRRFNYFNRFKTLLVRNCYQINSLFSEFSSFLYQSSLIRLKKILFFIYQKGSSYSISWLITRVNSIILKWFKSWYNQINFYYKDCLWLIKSIDHWLYKKQCCLINRVNDNKSLLWKIKHYFGNFNPYRSDFWVFGDFYSGFYLLKIIWLISS